MASELVDKYGTWAMIVGASAGLGAAGAETAAAHGFNVVLVARREQLLRETAAGLTERHGVETRILVIDLAEADAAERMLAGTDDLDLGVVVYNAAAEPEGLLEEATAEDLRTNIEVNCWTPTMLCRGLAPRMFARGRGAVAITSSMAALQGIARYAAYGAAKSYELILAEGLWYEWREHGVDVVGYVVGATASSTYQGAGESAYENVDLTPAEARILSPATPQEVADRLFRSFDRGPRQYSHDVDQQTAEAEALLPRSEVVEAMGRLTSGLASFSD